MASNLFQIIFRQTFLGLGKSNFLLGCFPYWSKCLLNADIEAAEGWASRKSCVCVRSDQQSEQVSCRSRDCAFFMERSGSEV